MDNESNVVIRIHQVPISCCYPELLVNPFVNDDRPIPTDSDGHQNKGMRLFTLLPVKSSFTMSNILIDKSAVQDLILGDKERKNGEAHAELYKTVRKLFKEDPMSVLNPFFNIERFETRTKKFVHFCTDGVSVSVLLGEESEPKPRACKPKRKRETKSL
jgi:hypothetical protein